MRYITRLGLLALVALAAAGCSQITVTSNTLVRGTARIADATTNAVKGTSDVTTDTADDVDARTHAARVRFVHSRYAMLKREAASGQGEDLDALAYMMRVDDKRAFAAAVQADYGTLFADRTGADRWLARLYRLMGAPPDMATTTVPAG